MVEVITCENIEFITRGLHLLMKNSIFLLMIMSTTCDIFQYFLLAIWESLNVIIGLTDYSATKEILYVLQIPQMRLPLLCLFHYHPNAKFVTRELVLRRLMENLQVDFQSK